MLQPSSSGPGRACPHKLSASAFLTERAPPWLRETSHRVIQSLMAEFPDLDPVGVAERLVLIQALQAEIEEMKRHAFVLPVSVVAPEGGV